MKTKIALLIAFFASSVSAAAEFQTGSFLCRRTGPGLEVEQRTYKISAAPFAERLPMIEYESQYTDPRGKVYPPTKQIGLGSLTIGSGLVTVRLGTTVALAFDDKGEPSLDYCRKVEDDGR